MPSLGVAVLGGVKVKLSHEQLQDFLGGGGFKYFLMFTPIWGR